MRKTARAIVLAFLTLLSAVILGVSSTLTTAALSLAAQTAYIMGGTGRPDPKDFPGYIDNVMDYYIQPNVTFMGCCKTVSVETPETAWPVYGGLTALTWRDSILQGVEDLDDVLQPAIADLKPNDEIVIFGYSQSGAIVAIEKRALADQLTDAHEQQIEWVIIGNVSRPNGGLNVRLPITIPIVNFPFGPPTPTDTNMTTTDIAMKWDIIADAPTYLFNPLAFTNALLGFWYVHGTYPDPTQASPDSTPGGYSMEQWQDMMDHPENYPDIVDVQYYGDTKYITVTPTVLPIVQPLHDLGLGFVADLVEPALRVVIEETGYDRSIPYGQPTPLRLIPIFNPIQLTFDVIAAIPQGIEQAQNNSGGGSLIAPTTTETLSTLGSFDSSDSPASVDLSTDGTTDPMSGNASGTNATRSNATEVKQENTAKQDERKGSEEINEGSEGTKKDTEGSKKNSEATKKDTEGSKKNSEATKKDTEGSKKDTEATKKDSDDTKKVAA